MEAAENREQGNHIRAPEEDPEQNRRTDGANRNAANRRKAAYLQNGNGILTVCQAAHLETDPGDAAQLQRIRPKRIRRNDGAQRTATNRM